jgi:uncharacterized membrane protein
MRVGCGLSASAVLSLSQINEVFFALIASVTLIAALVSRVGVPGLEDWRACIRWGLALALVATGIDHVATPERYLPMMPGSVPFPAGVVLFAGLCELAGAVGLLIPRLRYLAGVMLALYLVCVFPANIKNAIEGLSVDGLPAAQWYYWVRLLFQPIVIWWTLYAAEVIDWPLRQGTLPRTATGA